MLEINIAKHIKFTKLIDEKLDMTQQCALTAHKARCILGCIQSSMCQQVKGGDFLLHSCEIPPAVLCSAIKSKKDMGLLE